MWAVPDIVLSARVRRFPELRQPMSSILYRIMTEAIEADADVFDPDAS